MKSLQTTERSSLKQSSNCIFFSSNFILRDSKSQEKVKSIPQHAESMAELDAGKKRSNLDAIEVIEEELLPNAEEQKVPQPIVPEPQNQSVVAQKHLFKRLQSIREYNKFKVELKQQSTLKKQDTLGNYMRQSSSGRAARIAPEEKSQMQSLVRRTFGHKKKFFAWLMEQVTY